MFRDVIDWVFSNLVIPIGLAAVVYFSIRYAIRNWSANQASGMIAIAAAVFAWLMSWGTWWRHVWVYLLFDNFVRTAALVISLTILGVAVLIRRNTAFREWIEDLVST